MQSQPAAERSIGAIRCHLRSCVRSEWRPHRSIRRSCRPAGTAASSPTVTLLAPELKLLTISGAHMATIASAVDQAEVCDAEFDDRCGCQLREQALLRAACSQWGIRLCCSERSMRRRYAFSSASSHVALAGIVQVEINSDAKQGGRHALQQEQPLPALQAERAVEAEDVTGNDGPERRGHRHRDHEQRIGPRPVSGRKPKGQ